MSEKAIQFATEEDRIACERDLALFGRYFISNGKRLDPMTVSINKRGEYELASVDDAVAKAQETLFKK